MRIFGITDLHYYEKDPYKTQADSNLDTVINKANELNSDLLVLLGDSFHNPLQPPASPETTEPKSPEEVKNVLDLIKAKLEAFTGQYGYIYLPGNHDCYAWEIQKYFGHRYKFEVIGGVLILGLCTSDFNSYWYNFVSAKQLRDLEEAISLHSDKIAIPMFHVPIYQTIFDEPKDSLAHVGYWCVRNRQAVADVLANHPRIPCIINAHLYYQIRGTATGLGFTHVWPAHMVVSATAPYFELRDNYIIDVNLETGEVAVDAWSYPANARVSIYSTVV